MQPSKKRWTFCFWHSLWEKNSPDSSVLSSSIWWLILRGGRWKGALFKLWLRGSPLLPRTIAPSFSLLATFRKIWGVILCVQKDFWWFCWTHLLKSCIRESIGGNVELCQILVELLEENFKLLHRILFAVLGGEDEDDVGAYLLDQGGRGDVLLDELGQRIDWEPVKAQYGGLIHSKSATQTSYCQWTGWWSSHEWRGQRCPRQQTPPCLHYPPSLLRKEPLVLPAQRSWFH